MIRNWFRTNTELYRNRLFTYSVIDSRVPDSRFLTGRKVIASFEPIENHFHGRIQLVFQLHVGNEHGKGEYYVLHGKAKVDGQDQRLEKDRKRSLIK